MLPLLCIIFGIILFIFAIVKNKPESGLEHAALDLGKRLFMVVCSFILVAFGFFGVAFWIVRHFFRLFI